MYANKYFSKFGIKLLNLNCRNYRFVTGYIFTYVIFFVFIS